MMAKKFNKGLIAIIVGVLILLLVVNVDGGLMSGLPLPVYDGARNNFKLEVDSYSNAIEGQPFTVTLNVLNPDPTPGTMYVQCSLLNKDNYPWLGGLQATVPYEANSVENCIANEAFTQTLQITLTGEQDKDFTYAITTPTWSNGDNVIYCSAYEQCYSIANEDTMESMYVIKPIIIQPANTEPVTPGDQCVVKEDCKDIYVNEQMCINGYCRDASSQDGVSDSTIFGWVKEHKLLIMAIALLAMLIGGYYVYKQPKVYTPY